MGPKSNFQGSTFISATKNYISKSKYMIQMLIENVAKMKVAQQGQELKIRQSNRADVDND